MAESQDAFVLTDSYTRRSSNHSKAASFTTSAAIEDASTLTISRC